MSVGDTVKAFSGMTIGVAIFSAISVLGILLLYGIASVSVVVMKYSPPVIELALLAMIIAFFTSFIPPMWGRVSVAFSVLSMVFGTILWMSGVAYTYFFWGMFGVIVGLVILGIGCVPMAMLAAITHGQWADLLSLIFLVILTFGCRFYAAWLAAKADRREITPPISAAHRIL